MENYIDANNLLEQISEAVKQEADNGEHRTCCLRGVRQPIF